MEEADNWESLEFRVCREFAGLRENHLRFLWCDGFIPEQYLLDDSVPRITGHLWICNGPSQEEWQFSLFLTCQFQSRAEIDWPEQLPPESTTRWLALDQHGRRIQIEPSAAVPDGVS